MTINKLLATVGPDTTSGLPRMRLTVSRNEILTDAIAFFKGGDFHYNRELRVRFEAEPAVDGGGPKREFFSLLLKSLVSPTESVRLFEGRPGRYLPMHNMDALMGGLYKVAGRMIAASALQGGPGFPCLAPAIYTHMATMSLDSVIDEISPLDLPDPNLADTVEKVRSINFKCAWSYMANIPIYFGRSVK